VTLHEFGKAIPKRRDERIYEGSTVMYASAMRMRLHVGLLLVSWGLSSCAARLAQGPVSKNGSPSDAQSLAFIAQCEDDRTLHSGTLPNLALEAKSRTIRQRALLALGRIQDWSAVPVLLKSARDSDPLVRRDAAHALILLSNSWHFVSDADKNRLTEGVLEAEAAERDLDTQASLLKALGRLATPRAIERLLERLHETTRVQPDAALALGVAAKNRVSLNAPSFEAFESLLGVEAPAPTRFAAAYLLANLKNPQAAGLLRRCARDSAPEIRSVCARGLGDTGAAEDLALLKILVTDGDPRVAIEAIRSLARRSSACAGADCPFPISANELTSRLGRPFEKAPPGEAHVLLALAQAALPPSAGPLLAHVRATLKGSWRNSGVSATSTEWAVVDCRLASAEDRLSGHVRQVRACGGGLLDEGLTLSQSIQSVMTLPAANACTRTAEFGPYLKHRDLRVRMAAIALLGESLCEAGTTLLRARLGVDDPIERAAVALALAKHKDLASLPEIKALVEQAASTVELAPTMAEAAATLGSKELIAPLEKWRRSPHATIRHAAVEALWSLTGRRDESNLAPAPGN
jgi:HEAT repeat protein